MEDEIIQIGGFPTYKLVYNEGTPGEYEFQKAKSWFKKIDILAYDNYIQ